MKTHYAPKKIGTIAICAVVSDLKKINYISVAKSYFAVLAIELDQMDRIVQNGYELATAK